VFLELKPIEKKKEVQKGLLYFEENHFLFLFGGNKNNQSFF